MCLLTWTTMLIQGGGKTGMDMDPTILLYNQGPTTEGSVPILVWPEYGYILSPTQNSGPIRIVTNLEPEVKTFQATVPNFGTAPVDLDSRETVSTNVTTKLSVNPNPTTIETITADAVLDDFLQYVRSNTKRILSTYAVMMSEKNLIQEYYMLDNKPNCDMIMIGALFYIDDIKGSHEELKKYKYLSEILGQVRTTYFDPNWKNDIINILKASSNVNTPADLQRFHHDLQTVTKPTFEYTVTLDPEGCRGFHAMTGEKIPVREVPVEAVNQEAVNRNAVYYAFGNAYTQFEEQTNSRKNLMRVIVQNLMSQRSNIANNVTRFDTSSIESIIRGNSAYTDLFNRTKTLQEEVTANPPAENLTRDFARYNAGLASLTPEYNRLELANGEFMNLLNEIGKFNANVDSGTIQQSGVEVQLAPIDNILENLKI